MARVAANAFVASLFWIFCLISASAVPLQAKPGEDVVLRCRAPRGAAVGLLEWIRPDMKSGGYVFFYRNNRAYDRYQHPSFRGRVELRDPQMKDGDTSVILKNVSINDAGSYHCRIIFANTGGDMTELRNLTVTGSGGAAGDKDEGKTVEVTKDGGDEDEGNKDVNVGLVAGLSVVLLLCVVVLTIIVVKCLRQAAYHLPPEKQSPA